MYKVYNETIYNEEVKNRFLEKYEGKTEYAYKRVFLNSANIEEVLGKDLYDFSIEEMKQVLYNLDPKNLATSQSLGSIVKNYIDWAIKEGYRKSNINPLEKIYTEWYEQFVGDKKLYITENELVHIEGLCNNYQDIALIRILFEGAGGKSWVEVRNLKKNDIIKDENAIILTDENGNKRKLNVSTRCIEFLIEASEETKYFKKNAEMDHERIRNYADLAENDYVFRPCHTRLNEPNREIQQHTINRRIREVSDLIGSDYLTPRSVFISGMIKYAKDLLIETGKLEREEYEKICKRFNYNVNSIALLKKTVNIETIKQLYGNIFNS